MKKAFRKLAALIMGIAMPFYMTPVSAEGENSSQTDPAYNETMSDYSLNNILNSYVMFVQGDAKGTHIVGPAAVGGNAVFTSIGGLSAAEAWKDPTRQEWNQSLYVKGTLTVRDIVNTNQPVVLGTGNKTQKIGYVSDPNNLQSYEKGKNIVAELDYSDNYIDFENAFAKIRAQADEIAAQAQNYAVPEAGDFSPESGSVTFTPKKSQNYNLSSLNSTVNFNLANTDIQPNHDMVIYSDAETFNIGYMSGIKPAEYSKKGMNITFVLPKATKVNLADGHFGHVIAPNAVVSQGASDYQGCIVAKSVSSSGEGHLWGYTGNKFEPDGNVTPEGPEEKEEFASLTVTKTDKENNRLADAEFGIYSDSDCMDELTSITTGEDGTASLSAEEFKDLLIDKEAVSLYMKEKTAPEGYQLSENVTELTLTVTTAEDKENNTVTKTYSLTDTDGSASLTIENEKEEPEPTEEPTEEPTAEPTDKPSPSTEPTSTPEVTPTAEPSEEPTAEPREEPTAEPSEQPSEEPTAEPSEEPTAEPTDEPSPSTEPTSTPEVTPTAEPSEEPTEEPSEEPTEEPEESHEPEVPVTPDYPDDNDHPDQPVTPVVPETPDMPEEESEEKPFLPLTNDEPEESTETEKVIQPEEVREPAATAVSEKAEEKDAVPKTGVSYPLKWGMICVTALGMAWLADRRRN